MKKELEEANRFMVKNSKNAHVIMGLILDISNDKTINDSERSEKVKKSKVVGKQNQKMDFHVL